MRKFKTHYDISKMTIQELLQYRQQLRNNVKEIRKDIITMDNLWDSVEAELKYQVHRMSQDIIMLEKRRLTAETVKEWASLDLH